MNATTSNVPSLSRFTFGNPRATRPTFITDLIVKIIEELTREEGWKRNFHLLWLNKELRSALAPIAYKSVYLFHHRQVSQLRVDTYVTPQIGMFVRRIYLRGARAPQDHERPTIPHEMARRVSSSKLAAERAREVHAWCYWPADLQTDVENAIRSCPRTTTHVVDAR
ncbi:hypothetical protein AAF712_008791 [Marasmius tenuissimus]|uniref:Integrase zinc-binding domain-containing protein n=1 Tax=Marasmius tenuissimus TaxID=585030 RepID=A0ABR2ZRK0_9AGAR